MASELIPLDIVTENLEIFRFPSEEVIEAELPVEGDSSCPPMKKFSRVRIRLKASANNPKADLTKYSSYCKSRNPVLPFDRLLHLADITQVYVSRKYGGFVPWEDGQDDYENRLQHCRLDEDGSLLIEIGDDKNNDV